jgi:hypothetical protein
MPKWFAPFLKIQGQRLLKEMMRLSKAQDGTWSLLPESEADKATQEQSPGPYFEALPRYFTAFDLAFTRAKERSEYAFIETLLRVRGMQDAGWDPFETSLEAIGQMRAIHAQAESYLAKRHLELWLLGHIVEASEPYEILSNLIAISQGDTFKIIRFPPRNRRPQSPGGKIDQLEQVATTADLPGVVSPMREVWDRDLRNAIFHSDYSVHGPEVRFKKNGHPHAYGHEEIMTLVNGALAYFDALRFLNAHYIGSYTEPKEIVMHPLNAGAPGERAVVMVREGYGAIGPKHAWTLEELQRGHINWHFGRFSTEEAKLISADPMRALFPDKERHSDQGEQSGDVKANPNPPPMHFG